MHPAIVSRATVRPVLVLVLVATFLWVPAAVRATRPVRGSANGFRLNRGFDVPVENDLVPPADTPSLVPAILQQRTTRAVAIAWREAHQILPDTPDTVAPELLRGPPSSPAV